MDNTLDKLNLIIYNGNCQNHLIINSDSSKPSSNSRSVMAYLFAFFTNHL